MRANTVRRRIQDGLLLAGAVALALGWALPLLWSIAVSFRPPNETLAPGRIWFGSHLSLDSYRAALAVAPFARYYLNTLLMVGGILVAQLVTITLAGFAFARYRFPGARALLLIILLQSIIPSAVLIVPNYSTIRNLGLFDTLWALILPSTVSAFGTLLMRQTFLDLPRDLDDAARADGAGWLQVLWYVYIPYAVPALLAFSLVSIAAHWSEFFWPLIVTNSEESRPLTVGLAVLAQLGEQGAQWSLVMAGTMIVIAPLLALFILLQRHFTESFVHTGIK